MTAPRATGLFSSRPAPISGIDRAVLDGGSVDRSFGFGRVVPNAVASDRYLWAYVAREGRSPGLAAVDLDEEECRTVATTSPGDPVPAIDPSTAEATVAVGASVKELGPGPDGEHRLVGSLERSDHGAGRVTAGMTRSADGDRLGLAFETDGTVHVGAIDRSTGEIESWHTRPEPHATVQFSPTDPSLALFARDADPSDRSSSVGKAWLAREGLGARPLSELLPERHHGHWWDPDGTGLWYVEPEGGVAYLDLELGRRETVWSVSARRAHATRDGRLLAATTADDGRATLVVHDRSTGDSVAVDRVADARARWEPQPQFGANDEFLAYTTAVHDRPTVALLPVSSLREAL